MSARSHSTSGDHQVSGIAGDVSSFVHSVDGLQSSFPPQMVMTAAISMACVQDMKAFLDKNAKVDEAAGTVEFDPEHIYEFDELESRRKKADVAAILMPQTFVTALISQYDAFLGGLLRRLYKAQPAMLEGSQKQLNYAKLCECKDLEHAKESILEKEIEDILRMSHSDQFETMEQRFGIKLREELPIWPVFIELTERRNLFTHCNGQVSTQYLVVCDRHKVQYRKRPNVGDKLGVTPDYFERAHACIFEIGVKLAHVLWRKVIPNERQVADENLLSTVYALLVGRNYKLAITMGAFFNIKPIKQHSTEDIKRRMAVNLAQAHKWDGRPEECTRILDDEDWSSCSPEFKFAVAILKDEFDEAAGMMKVVQATGTVSKADYRHWPLFKEFRKSQVFLDTYREIYGHDLVPLEPKPVEKFFGPFASIMPLATAADPKAVGTSESPNKPPAGQSQSAPPS